MAGSTPTMAVRALATATTLLLATACSSVSLGWQDVPIDVDLERVTWTDEIEGHHHGELALVQHAAMERWRVHLIVPDQAFERRSPMALERLPLGSRVYVIAPEQVQYRGRRGSLVVSRRGGGMLDGTFVDPIDDQRLELSMSWTSWHVDDRRVLGAGPDDDGLPQVVE